jgi:hypothetical protein
VWTECKRQCRIQFRDVIVAMVNKSSVSQKSGNFEKTELLSASQEGFYSMELVFICRTRHLTVHFKNAEDRIR